jgi:hypothetical protein
VYVKGHCSEHVNLHEYQDEHEHEHQHEYEHENERKDVDVRLLSANVNEQWIRELYYKIVLAILVPNLYVYINTPISCLCKTL